MKNFLSLFDRLFASAAVEDDVRHTMDHVVPAAPEIAAQSHQLRKARRRHGRAFITATPVKRITAPTHLLEELNRKSAKVPTPQLVTPIGARRKS